MNKSLAAIILAAGKGARFNSTTVNKVALPLGGKPMIVYAVDFVEKLNIHPIIVVVGFAKDSVIEVLKGKEVIFALQKEQLGTGHAVLTALPKLPSHVENVLVVQGDDAMFYNDENLLLVKKLVEKHNESDASVTFLTVELTNPFGIGRIVRDEVGNVVSITEQKEVDEKQRSIRETNAACYVFKVDFLKKYLPKVTEHHITGEHQLTDLIKLAVDNKEPVEAIAAGAIPWRGVNTQDELLEAGVLWRNIRKNPH